LKYYKSSILFLVFAQAVYSQQVFKIWPVQSNDVKISLWHEQEDDRIPTDPLVYNVVEPTLTFFPSDPSLATGTSLIVCPGGSFCYLHILTEGAAVANWLNKKGISVFVLKYRIAHMLSDDPMKEKNARIKDSSLTKLVTPMVPLAISDARQAIVYLRTHASELGIDPQRIGIMGFSAGGTLAAEAAFDYSGENRPNFVAPIYPFVPPSLPMNIQPDEPPIFIAAATDDELHLVPMSINLYSKWLATGHSAELHIYSKGGHGFGMNKQSQPSDHWIERFADWLQIQGLMKK
jgi:acetyl esterase/lipase